MRYELTLPGAVITYVGLAAETRRAACTHIPVSREGGTRSANGR